MLWSAVQERKADVAKLLIASGADVNATSRHGQTALITAIFKGHLAVAGLLVDSKADVNAANEDGWTALMFAAVTDQPDAVMLLIAAKADVGAKNKRGGTSIDVSTQNGAEEEPISDKEGNETEYTAGGTAVMIAVQYGAADVVQLLLKAGADINATGEDGDTALMTCAIKRGLSAGVKLLIRLKADIDERNDYVYGFTALALAVRGGNTDVAQLLLGAKANVNARTNRGLTPLMLAALND